MMQLALVMMVAASAMQPLPSGTLDTCGVYVENDERPTYAVFDFECRYRSGCAWDRGAGKCAGVPCSDVDNYRGGCDDHISYCVRMDDKCVDIKEAARQLAGVAKSESCEPDLCSKSCVERIGRCMSVEAALKEAAGCSWYKNAQSCGWVENCVYFNEDCMSLTAAEKRFRRNPYKYTPEPCEPLDHPNSCVLAKNDCGWIRGQCMHMSDAAKLITSSSQASASTDGGGGGDEGRPADTEDDLDARGLILFIVFIILVLVCCLATAASCYYCWKRCSKKKTPMDGGEAAFSNAISILEPESEYSPMSTEAKVMQGSSPSGEMSL